MPVDETYRDTLESLRVPGYMEQQSETGQYLFF